MKITTFYFSIVLTLSLSRSVMERQKKDIVQELHKSCRKNFKRRRVIVKGINDLFQIDLMDMRAYADVNRGYSYILAVIDVFSKYGWTIPILRKDAISVTNAMAEILKERKPKNVQSDCGLEFYNHHFKSLMEQFNINHYSTFSILKASVAERFIRTIKTKLWKKFSLRGTYQYLDILPSLVKEYNNTVHRTIKLKPIDVGEKEEKKLLNSVYKNQNESKRKSKYLIGDFVRISKYKNLFEKGYTPAWSTEIFKIKKINRTDPVTYILEDFEKNIIRGCFYAQELQKTKHPNVFLVEKVLKRKGKRAFVKWLGFSENYNSWTTLGEK